MPLVKSPPQRYSGTVTGALLTFFMSHPERQVLYPGGFYRGQAKSDRPDGDFAVITKESLATAIYTSLNKIEEIDLEVRYYAEDASAAQELGEWFDVWVRNPVAYPLQKSALIGAVETDDSLEETADYAPRVTDRLHCRAMSYRLWIAFPNSR
jgi:hypothetical protein